MHAKVRTKYARPSSLGRIGLPCHQSIGGYDANAAAVCVEAREGKDSVIGVSVIS